jgi:hypothetical protein
VDFTSSTQAFINGQPRSTILLSSQQLRVTLTITDVANLGSLSITLSGPGSAIGAAEVLVVDTVYSAYLPMIITN